MTLTGSPEEQLEQLRHVYASQLSSKVQVIEETCDKLLKDAGGDTTIKSLRHMAHNLAGSGATFGFSALSKAGSALEVLISGLAGSGEKLSVEQLEQVKHLVSELRAASCKSDSLAYSNQDKNIFCKKNIKKPIYIVDDDNNLAIAMASQITNFGYNVQVFTRIHELEKAVAQEVPSAIIMDIIFPEGDFAGTDIITKIRQTSKEKIPVIFISVNDSIEARLRAVRADCDGYFVKPVDIYALIDSLNSLTAPEDTEPYRILIVDDEPELARFYSLILQQAGIMTSLVTRPLEAIQQVAEFNPDLILMDVYMPDCSGIELARIIRQLPKYISIPIVFLSVERDIDRRLVAMGYGGDDFLTKPIQPVHLISAVTIRAKRSRELKNLMVRDSLTGLFNHSKLIDYLDRELAAANRNASRLAFAMIDIDNFKAVNDTYGHITGDFVLKSVSRLLQDRLRKSDIVGRYGGEEFTVILINTDGETAEKIINELGNSLRKIRYKACDTEFSITFSCGIATFPACGTADKLIIAADDALYRAKNAGRDRIVLAE